MRKLALLLAMAVGFSLMGFAQYGSTSTSGQSTTSDQSTTKTNKKAHKGEMGADKDKSLTGCVAGPNDEGMYTLKAKGHHREIEIGPSDVVKAHVGHEVKLTGEWEKSGEAIGENEKKETKTEKTKEHMKMERHFKVEKVDMVADTCPAAMEKMEKKEGGKK